MRKSKTPLTIPVTLQIMSYGHRQLEGMSVPGTPKTLFICFLIKQDCLKPCAVWDAGMNGGRTSPFSVGENYGKETRT